MNKHRLIIISLLVFLLVPIVAQPNMAQDFIQTAFDDSRGNKVTPESRFSPSAEGDISGQSITSFSETLADDVLFYPDLFLNDTGEVSSAGVYNPTGSGSYADTAAVDSVLFFGTNATTGTCYITMNFTIPDNLEGFYFNSYASYFSDDDGGDIYIYNWNSTSYDDVGNLDFFLDYNTGSTYDPDHWDTGSGIVRMKWTSVDADSDSKVTIDFAELQFYIMTLADAEHYAESFADVSDWTTGEGNPVTTNGDEMSLHLPNDAAYDKFYSNAPSITNVLGYYFEAHFANNATGALWYLYGYPQDNQAGGGYLLTVGNQEASTVAKTVKFYVEDNYALESFGLWAKCYGAGDTAIKIDYFRIAPSDEMGWQHDGSTIEGTTTTANMAVATDGDALTLTPSADANYLLFDVDTTATATILDSDYYLFLETYISSVTDGDADGKVWLIQLIGTDADEYTTPSPYYADETGYHRFNVFVSTIGDLEQIKVYIEDSLDRATFDYFKMYSIANYTVIEGGGSATNDLLYVDTLGQLVSAGVGTAYHRLDSDITYSVDTSVYNMLNVTFHGLDNPVYPIGIYTNVVPAYTTEWRFSLPSGTLTYLVIRFQTSATVTKVEFWTDTTDPVINNVWATPYTPIEQDSVTISVFITDWASVYTVKINAADSPVGFSDVDYSLTEGGATNIWSYSFAAGDLPAGYYSFVATVDDGQGTDVDMVVFRVLATVLQIAGVRINQPTDILAELSGHINRDASYTIYENDSSVGSGSVSEGWFSFTWNKDTTSGAYMMVGIYFVSSIYSEWVNGSYSTYGFYITSPFGSQNNVSIVIGARFFTSDLTMDYTILEDNVAITTGTITLSASGAYHVIKWDKSSATSVANWTIELQAGGSNLSIYGYNLIISGGNYYTYNSASSNTEGDEFTYNYAKSDTAAVAEAALQQLGTILLVVFSVIVGGILSVKYDRKNAQRRKPQDHTNDKYRTPQQQKRG